MKQVAIVEKEKLSMSEEFILLQSHVSVNHSLDARLIRGPQTKAPQTLDFWATFS